VRVEGQVTGSIGRGLLVLLGVGLGDGEAQVTTLVEKIVHLRIFEDEAGKMNYSLLDMQGEVLVVSQFTLYAKMRKGRRPAFSDAAPPQVAQPLCQRFAEAVAAHGLTVAGGIFGASMSVELCNEGPATIWLDSRELA
jgi:D-tyrosyl-tRNA(Tyr) deacylase